MGAASTGLLLLPEIARAQGSKIRVGFMLPVHRHVRAAWASRSRTACAWAINEKGGKLGGREIEWFKVDDESEPSKGVENANRLVQRDKVDVLIGTVHSGVQMGIQKCRTRLGRAQPHSQCGRACWPRVRCARQRVSHILHQLAAHARPGQGHGRQGPQEAPSGSPGSTRPATKRFEGFKESYTAAGGTIVKELGLPFPNVEFQALLTEIASLQAGRRGLLLCRWRRSAKFIRDYAAAGLKGRIPLYGSGFLTEGVLDAAGPAADGIMTTMHYSDSLDTPRNKAFRTGLCEGLQGMQPDVYAVQGYDTGLLLVQGANAVKGDLGQQGRRSTRPWRRKPSTARAASGR